MISKSLINRVFGSISQFTISLSHKPLGEGSCGTVRLGIHKSTSKPYAIKIICIDQNFQQPELSLLQREISIHYTLNHPHIVRLWDVIQTPFKIYMIMEYASIGNLFYFQNKMNTSFEEDDIFRLWIQTVAAVQYLHQINIFHRDIKPENILIDGQMNVLLGDFGWAADDINRERETFCGTFQYMAPEMIVGQIYDYRIDIWALGILLYQLVHNRAPFQAVTLEEMKTKIEIGCFQISSKISIQLKSLILMILQFDVNDRPSIKDIKCHPWVQKMKKLINQKRNQFSYNKRKRNVRGSMDNICTKNISNISQSMLINLPRQYNRGQKIPTHKLLKKKIKDKCRTLEGQNYHNSQSNKRNFLTNFVQKQNIEIKAIQFPQRLNQQIGKIQKEKSKMHLSRNLKHSRNRSNIEFLKTDANQLVQFPILKIQKVKSTDKLDKFHLLALGKSCHKQLFRKRKKQTNLSNKRKFQ